MEKINGFWTGNAYLTETQKQDNVQWIYNWITTPANFGWPHMYSLAGMLGNIDAESTVNPGLWQNLIQNYAMGYSLFQWTPATKYTNWCTKNGLVNFYMDSALKRLKYEFDHNLQWIATDVYPISFQNFITGYFDNNTDIGYCTEVFLRCYERAGIERLEYRIERANHWFEFLGGETPPSPIVPPPTPGLGLNKTTFVYNKPIWKSNIQARRGQRWQ